MANYFGTNGNDDLSGSEGPDKILGYDGDDVLRGLGGNDTINGGLGNDYIYGGPGNDTLIPGGNTGWDWLEGYTGNDLIDFSQVQPGIGYYNISEYNIPNAVTFQINGIKNSATVNKFASGLTNVKDVENALEYVSGSGGGLRLIGTSFGDTYDIRMAKGQHLEVRDPGGSDTIRLKSKNSDISLSYTLLDEGIDANMAKGRVKFGDDVDKIVGKGSVYRLRATDHDDTVKLSAANNYVYTFDGDDTIKARTPQTTIWIDPGAGNDIVDFGQAKMGKGFYNVSNFSIDQGVHVRIDGEKNTGKIDKFSQGTTTIKDVATAMAVDGNPLFGEGGGLRVTGTKYDDTINVTVGTNQFLQIREYGGSDTIKISQNDGYLTLSYRYENAPDGITANLAKGKVTWTFLGNSSLDKIKGPGSVSELRATDSDDKLLGSGKDEAFTPGLGNDIVKGRGGSDTVIYAKSPDDEIRDLTVNLKKGNATYSKDGADYKDKLVSIENAFGSYNDDVLRGTNGKNSLAGNYGDDRIFGLGGNDTLRGGKGDDLLVGGKGNDVFIFANKGGSDTIRGFAAKNNKEDIDLSDVTRIKGFKDLSKNHMEQVGKNVVIDDGNGLEITVLKTDIDDMNKGDFIF